MLGLVAAGAAGLAAWKLLPPKFNAFALLQVSSKAQVGFEHVQNRTEHTTLMKTTADRLKSRQVLMEGLKQDGVRNLATIRQHPDTLATLTWIEENLKVEYRDGSEVLNVALTGEDPGDLVAIVNAITKAYLKIVNTDEQSQRKERLKRLQEQYADAKQRLSEKLATKESLMNGQGAKDQASLVSRQLGAKLRLDNVYDKIRDHEYKLNMLNAKLAVMQKVKETHADQPVAEITIKELTDLDALLKEDVANMMKLDKAIKRYQNELRDDDFFMRQYRRDFASTKKRVDDRVQELRGELGALRRKHFEADVEAKITELKTEIAPLEGHIAKFKEQAEALTKESEAISEWTAKQMQLESEIQQQQQSVDKLYQEVDRANIQMIAEPRITSLGDAEWTSRDSKKRILMFLLAPLAALAGVVLAVAWWEFAARRIHGPDEVISGLAMRVVGAVPELPDPRRKRVANSQAEELYRHNLVESIDAIRTMLLRNANAENLRAIMVTSAVGGEGKTTLASNLAMSLARAGRRTLLIDCDLRRPAAHQLFEQTLQPGFSEVVLHEVELPDAVRQTTTDPNLYLLPAGHWDREVIQELAKSGLTGVFERLRQEFDFIIVDSHPVLPATDSLLIGQHVDAVIVSLMQDVSQVHHVHAACQQLATLGIRVFGAVVNGVPIKDYGKNYQYTTQPAAA
jgi:capsular exopolysaccharide synthesis family protein